VEAMSLKIRLILSYVAMIIVPIILSVITVSILYFFFIKNAAGAYNVGFTSNPYRQFLENNVEVFKEIKLASIENPDKFQDDQYLLGLENKMTNKNIGIVVRKNNNIIYYSKVFENLELNKVLPRFGVYAEKEVGHILVAKEYSLVRQQDFYFTDKTEGSIFLITDVKSFEEILKKFTNAALISIIVILILTDGILTYLVSRSVLNPIRTLRDAANQIKEGNLDFKINNTSWDEIGELCSDFEEMREKLKQSVDLQLQYENNRKELISNISHDLKTPITAIKGYVEGIIDGVADSPEKVDRYIGTIYKKAADIDRLIDELFLFSKLDLNKLPFNFEHIDILAYLRDCVEELKLDLENKNISLNLNCEVESLIVVLADRERLKRVIINIVENSIKYMDKDKGKVIISLSDYDSKYALIKIKDNGQGIKEKDLELIFNRFYRSDASRSTTTGGSGLGLSIAKMIIEEHGGNIWASSEEGLGTEIAFTLKKV
jgi:signal transduction histidine kinase